jgi:hypothetical protein
VAASTSDGPAWQKTLADHVERGRGVPGAHPETLEAFCFPGHSQFEPHREGPAGGSAAQCRHGKDLDEAGVAQQETSSRRPIRAGNESEYLAWTCWGPVVAVVPGTAAVCE